MKNRMTMMLGTITTQRDDMNDPSDNFETMFFRKNLKKFAKNEGNEAHAFRDGVETAFTETLTTGDDAHWTTLAYRKDRNGNMAWYVDLYSCSQEQFMSLQQKLEEISNSR